MIFETPSEGRSFEATIAREAERMKARRAKATERRKVRHDGFWDDQTVEAPRPKGPRLCSEPDCSMPHKARGLCAACYKSWRRSQGKVN